MSTHPELPERDRRILGVLVQRYIDDGEPISSLWLANRGFGVSSATLRNILARLEEQGLVRQPHTSAGRVPTDSGYRLYVDALLETRRKPKPVEEVIARLRRSNAVGSLLEHASHELSRASHQIGFAVASASPIRLQHIDFVSLEGSRVLVIVVAAGGRVTQKVIDTEERYSSTTLTQAANYINTQF